MAAPNQAFECAESGGVGIRCHRFVPFTRGRSGLINNCSPSIVLMDLFLSFSVPFLPPARAAATHWRTEVAPGHQKGTWAVDAGAFQGLKFSSRLCSLFF